MLTNINMYTTANRESLRNAFNQFSQTLYGWIQADTIRKGVISIPPKPYPKSLIDPRINNSIKF